MRIVLLLGLGLFLSAARADLYRWVDPESGSIKFSSYPPPWYGDPAKERRAPKVEVIPERANAPNPVPKPEGEARAEPGPEPRPKAAARPIDTIPARPAAIPEPDPLPRNRADGR